MSENDLIQAGFEKKIVPKKESGNKNDYYYYFLSLGILDFTSNGDDETNNDEWYVYPDSDANIKVTDISEVTDVAKIIKSWTK